MSKSMKNRPKKPLETTLGKAVQPEKDPDWSHIKKPLNTSLFGLKQVLSLYKTATEEVQEYITFECEVLYECRICRTIFRSLANFILHKRNFCTEKFNHFYNTNPDKDENYVNLLNEPEESSRSTTPSCSPQKENNKEDVSPTIINNLLAKDVQIVENNILLEKIDSTEAAVFQSIKTNNEQLMKSEVMEIHGIFENNEVVLDSEGKVCQLNSNNTKTNLICSECNLGFSTKKTLMSHIKYKHNKSCTVYLCPDCKDTFANGWGVHRHLYKVHRRTLAQVRRMRAQIHSNIITKDQEENFIKKIEKKKIEDDIENEWMNNIESDKDFQMCGGCGKRFERKAALNSHSQMCAKRLAICNNIKVITKKEKKIKGASRRKPKPSKILNNDVPTKQIEHIDVNNLEAADVFKIIGFQPENDKNKIKIIDEKDEVDFLIPSPEENIYHISSDDDDCILIEDVKEEKEDTASLSSSVDNFIVPAVVEVRKRKRSSSCDIDIRKKSPKFELIDNGDLFVTWITPYVNQEALKCLPCDKNLDSSYELLRHMSLHFSWYRFQCKYCSFMSFDKFECKTHILNEHEIISQSFNDVIIPIAKWKILSMSHEFKDIKAVIDEDKNDIKEKSIQPVENGKNIADDKLSSTSYETGPTTVQSYKRSSRNRTKSVKTIQDDFIYDLNVIKMNAKSMRLSKVSKRSATKQHKKSDIASSKTIDKV